MCELTNVWFPPSSITDGAHDVLYPMFTVGSREGRDQAEILRGQAGFFAAHPQPAVAWGRGAGPRARG